MKKTNTPPAAQTLPKGLDPSDLVALSRTPEGVVTATLERFGRIELRFGKSPFTVSFAVEKVGEDFQAFCTVAKVPHSAKQKEIAPSRYLLTKAATLQLAAGAATVALEPEEEPVIETTEEKPADSEEGEEASEE